MRKAIVGLLLVLAANRAEAGYDTGNDLIVGVKAALRYAETKSPETEVEEFARVYWTGYINGFRTSSSDLAGNLGCALPCKIPTNVPTSQLLRVIDKYLADHPDKLNGSAALLITYA